MITDIRLYQGDCLTVLRELPDASVDSVVTDPPYALRELSVELVTKVLTAWLTGDREHATTGKGFMGREWDAFVPSPAVWDECLRVLKPGGHMAVFAGGRTQDLMSVSIRLAGFEIRDTITWLYSNGFPKSKAMLKPSSEPIIVARKPFVGSEAACILTSGLGGLNIEDSRVATCGRWPANAVLSHDEECDELCQDGCPVVTLDAQSGQLTSGLYKPEHADNGKVAGTLGAMSGRARMVSTYGDTGGASRFYNVFRYQAKAPKSERPVVDGKSHPTVKPLALIRWLCKLITPEGGTILDPFVGSGTTGQAAEQEGFKSILIERDPESIEFIHARLGTQIVLCASPSQERAPTMPEIDSIYDTEPSPLGDGKPEEPADRYGRKILPRGDGTAAPYTRATTLAGSLDSGHGVLVWQKYRAAWGVAQRDDLIARLRAVPVDDKATIREVCDTAELIAGTDAAANDGTAAHAVLQRVDQGESIEDIHPYYQLLVRNYQAELARCGITVLPEYVERTYRCARYDIEGHPDNIYRLSDGSLAVGDKKTCADLAKSERSIAAQLALYANSEHVMNYETGQYESVPEVRKDFALIIAIDTDTWAVTVERIDIIYGWGRVRLAAEMRESNKIKHIRHPYLPEGTWDFKPKTVLPDQLAQQVRSADQQTELYLEQRSSDGYATPSVERSPESTARIQAIADGVRRDSEAKLAAAVQTGPVGAPDANRTPQAAAMPAPQPPATVGPTPNTTPPPAPTDYPVVDPTARVRGILEVRKNDKARLQGWCAALGGTDLAHNRKWLAEWIVEATPGSYAIEPAGEGDIGPGKINSSQNYGGENPRHPQTLAEAGLPPAPAEPPGQPVVGPGTNYPIQDNTPEGLAHKAAGAPSLDALRAVWKSYTDTYGPDSWDASGSVKAAADARADFLKRQLAGDDGPPF